MLKLNGYPPAMLDSALSDQASSLALDDVFYLMGWILIFLFVVVLITFFVKKNLFSLEKERQSI
jgi:DHA2 family multidrug resistance protein